MENNATEEKIQNLEAIVASLAELLAVQEKVVGDQYEKIRQEEESLRDSELKYRTLFESSRDAIMMIEPPDWRFTSANPATVKMFLAKDEAEFISTWPWQVSPERQPDGRLSAEKAEEMIGKAVKEGSNFFEWTHRRLNGEDFPATVLATRFMWKGQLIVQGTVRDITKQKQAEIALKESNERFLTFIKEAAMRLKNPIEVVEENISIVVGDIEKDHLDNQEVMLQLKIQIKSLEQIRQNIIELNKAILEHYPDLSENSFKFVME